MFDTNILEESSVKRIINEMGPFSVVEYQKDMSVSPATAQLAYFCSEMNIKKRQVVIQVNSDGVILQAGAMEKMIGPINVKTDVKGAADLLGKFVGSKVTKESAVKPWYFGNGILTLEPTYKHILLTEIDDWADGLVIEDGLFLACEHSVQMKVTPRTNLSSAVLGNEGLFSTKLFGHGVVCLESPVPECELTIIELENDTCKIDGNMAIAWSGSLQFTVERTTKTLVGSAASGEGLVNTYRGTGKILCVV